MVNIFYCSSDPSAFHNLNCLFFSIYVNNLLTSAAIKSSITIFTKPKSAFFVGLGLRLGTWWWDLFLERSYFHFISNWKETGAFISKRNEIFSFQKEMKCFSTLVKAEKVLRKVESDWKSLRGPENCWEKLGKLRGA